MDETNSPQRPSAADPETDEAAEIAQAAEGGDQAAEVALAEAAAPASEDAPREAVEALEEESAEVPEDDVTDVATEEATVLEAEAEEALPQDIVGGEDEGPLFGTGPDTYTADAVAPVADAAIPAEAEATEAEPAQAESAQAESAKAESAQAEPALVEAEEARPRSAFEGPGDWYVVHTYAGYENKVKTNLHSRIGSMQMEEKIFDVVIPMEDVMEIKGGKRQVVQRKVFPGYLLVKMIYDNDSWYVVRNTPGVTGFVSSGTGTKPTPLSRREVEKILAVKEETQVKPTFRLEWEEGDVVRIVTGPFADFTGTIAEINVEQSRLKVLVNIFDRETPVELGFGEVAKS